MAERFVGETTIETVEYLEPTIDEPSFDALQAQEFDGIVDATDGCHVEPDGTCEHGHVSWLIYLELI